MDAQSEKLSQYTKNECSLSKNKCRKLFRQRSMINRRRYAELSSVCRTAEQSRHNVRELNLAGAAVEQTEVFAVAVEGIVIPPDAGDTVT